MVSSFGAEATFIVYSILKLLNHNQGCLLKKWFFQMAMWGPVVCFPACGGFFWNFVLHSDIIGPHNLLPVFWVVCWFHRQKASNHELDLEQKKSENISVQTFANNETSFFSTFSLFSIDKVKTKGAINYNQIQWCFHWDPILMLDRIDGPKLVLVLIARRLNDGHKWSILKCLDMVAFKDWKLLFTQSFPPQ